MGVCLMLWSEAVLTTRVANASLLANSSPIFVVLFAWLVLRERLPAIFWLGLVLSTGGMVWIIGVDILLNPS
jgi:drug/metabolite transporter (DMT)-like permease